MKDANRKTRNKRTKEREAVTSSETADRFASPFRLLNVTADDCVSQLRELHIDAKQLADSTALFNAAIEDVLSSSGYPTNPDAVEKYLAVAYEFVQAGMRRAECPTDYWPLVACHATLSVLFEAQRRNSLKLDAATVNAAMFAQTMMNIAWKPRRLRDMEAIARDSLGVANKAAEKESAHQAQIRTAQKTGSALRRTAAQDARKLATETLWPEWRKANPDERKSVGYEHIAKVLTARGYKNANGAPITWKTVKGYFRKPRSTKRP